MVGDGKEVRVSVALASYNGARYLREQIDSILCQLEEADELIVSDDGSSDGTEEILLEYQEADSRVHFSRGSGKGVKKNVEHALSLASGSYIFLADQDDIWEPGKVSRMLEALKGGAYLAIHDARVFEGEESGRFFLESFFAFRDAGPGVLKNIVKNSYIGCCMAFRREVLDIALPIPGDIEMHDQWIGVLSDYAYGNSVFLREPLLRYRRHGANQSAMRRYGLARMARNRAVFLWRFFGRIAHIRQKK